MVRFSITGGIACGKSLVGSFMRDLGVEVCEADDLAHRLMEPDGGAYGLVIRSFGSGILDADGRIDRKRLGALVFADDGERMRLNAIVHPLVRQAWRTWMDERAAMRCRTAAVIVPLLYEVGEGAGWDAVVCVCAGLSVQHARLLERGLTEEEACQRVAAQMAQADKAERADYVIVNDGTRDVLQEQTKRVLESILEK
jgi:dephospho-CoA kinase